MTHRGSHCCNCKPRTGHIIARIEERQRRELASAQRELEEARDAAIERGEVIEFYPMLREAWFYS